MGHQVEAGPERIRDHLRRPHHTNRKLADAKTGSTVNLTPPRKIGDAATLAPEGAADTAEEDLSQATGQHCAVVLIDRLGCRSRVGWLSVVGPLVR
jgi:hypothetical protein